MLITTVNLYMSYFSRENIERLLLKKERRTMWKDIVGQDSAKKMLNLNIKVPLERPEYVELNYFKPMDGILLYGPPGTGKSMLCEALSNEAGKCNFMKPMLSDLMSKWVGESEKYIRTLFDVAKKNSPCIIFIDEIDGLMGSRENSTGSSTKIISELLVQMQHLGEEGVFVIGATNNPWSLDAAFFRRFNACFYVGLPGHQNRKDLFKKYLGDVPCLLSDEDYEMLAYQSEKYSSAHISRIVEHTKLLAVQKCETATYFRQSLDYHGYWTPCLGNEMGAKKINHALVKAIIPPPVTMCDVQNAIHKVKPQVDAQYLKKLRDWSLKNGQDGNEEDEAAL